MERQYTINNSPKNNLRKFFKLGCNLPKLLMKFLNVVFWKGTSTYPVPDFISKIQRLSIIFKNTTHFWPKNKNWLFVPK